MRKADYRAWDTRTKTMIRDFSNEAGLQALIGDTNNLWRHGRYIKMQGSGMYDKNFRQIYEGDRIRYIGGDAHGTAVIEWLNGGLVARWMTGNIRSTLTPMLYIGCPEEIEVLDNRFES